MNNTKLNELLENIFTNRRDVWEKTYRILLRKRKLHCWHNTEAWIKLNKAYLAVLSFGRLFPWLNLPYCRNWARDKPTTATFHVKRSWKTFLREMDLNTPATNFPLGLSSRGECARISTTYLNHVSRSLVTVGLKWAEIPAFISDLLLHPCTRQRSGMIRFE